MCLPEWHYKQAFTGLIIGVCVYRTVASSKLLLAWSYEYVVMRLMLQESTYQTDHTSMCYRTDAKSQLSSLDNATSKFHSTDTTSEVWMIINYMFIGLMLEASVYCTGTTSKCSLDWVLQPRVYRTDNTSMCFLDRCYNPWCSLDLCMLQASFPWTYTTASVYRTYWWFLTSN